MSKAQQVASALRHLAFQLPPPMVSRLDDDLETVQALVSEVLTGSVRHDDVLMELAGLRTSLVRELAELCGTAKHQIETKAGDLAVADAPGPAPEPVGRSSRKAAELNSEPVPRTQCKDSNERMRVLRDEFGWGWEKRASHVHGFGPDGETMVVPSTPSGPAGRNQLGDEIKRLRKRRAGG